MSQSTTTEAPRRPTVRIGVDRPEHFGWVVAVVATGMAAYLSARWLTPEPTDADVAWSWFAEAGTTLSVGFAFFGAMLLLQDRPRGGYALMAAASWTMLAVVVGCPSTGHHTAAMWWAAQLACTAPFVAVTTMALAVSLRSR